MSELNLLILPFELDITPLKEMLDERGYSYTVLSSIDDIGKHLDPDKGNHLIIENCDSEHLVLGCIQTVMYPTIGGFTTITDGDFELVMSELEERFG